MRVSQKPEISGTQGSFLKVTREARWESKQEQPNLGLLSYFFSSARNPTWRPCACLTGALPLAAAQSLDERKVRAQVVQLRVNDSMKSAGIVRTSPTLCTDVF